VVGAAVVGGAVVAAGSSLPQAVAIRARTIMIGMKSHFLGERRILPPIAWECVLSCRCIN